MKELDYGIVAEFEDGTQLWLEAITDVIDGFVLRDQDGNGLAVFSEDEYGGSRAWSDAHDKKYLEEPNAETIKAMQEVDEMIKNGTGKRYHSFQEIIDDLNDE